MRTPKKEKGQENVMLLLAFYNWQFYIGLLEYVALPYFITILYLFITYVYWCVYAYVYCMVRVLVSGAVQIYIKFIPIGNICSQMTT